MKADTKVTLRISQVELDAIDDFLVRHPEYKTRSDFIRYAVMNTIQQLEKAQFGSEIVQVRLSKMVLNILSDMVDLGLFLDLDNAVNYFLNRSVQSNRLNEEISTMVQGYSNSTKLLDNFREEISGRGKNEIRKKGDLHDR